MNKFSELHNKEIWYEVNDKTNVESLNKVCQLEYTTLFCHVKNLSKLNRIKVPQSMHIALLVDAPSDLENLKEALKQPDKVSYVLTEQVEQIEALRRLGNWGIGLYTAVDNREDLDRVTTNLLSTDLTIVTFKDPTNIPLELVLAVGQSNKTRIFKRVASAEDGGISMQTMEKGSDGILLASNKMQEIMDLAKALSHANLVQLELKEALVTGVLHAGMGSRVCIDTTSELFQDEGMICGSTSNGGLLICTETHFLPYMNLRPFRVNAGGLHLYTWGPNNLVPYLSDLKAGDRVFAINSKGQARVVTIGRIKQERRPLLMISATIEGTPVNCFIQDDWHVRVFGSQGEIRNSSEIKVGDKLLGFLDQPGRHVGLKIKETINEV